MRLFLCMKVSYDKFIQFSVTFCICLFITVIASQFFLLSDNHISISVSNKFDGKIFNDEYSIKLKMISGIPSDKIFVLLNGDEYDKFSSDEICIYVDRQSVIEIYNNENYPVSVEISEIGDNVDVLMNNGIVDVKNIGILCRVNPKNE